MDIAMPPRDIPLIARLVTRPNEFPREWYERQFLRLKRTLPRDLFDGFVKALRHGFYPFNGQNQQSWVRILRFLCGDKFPLADFTVLARSPICTLERFDELVASTYRGTVPTGGTNNASTPRDTSYDTSDSDDVAITYVGPAPANPLPNPRIVVSAARRESSGQGLPKATPSIENAATARIAELVQFVVNSGLFTINSTSEFLSRRDLQVQTVRLYSEVTVPTDRGPDGKVYLLSPDTVVARIPDIATRAKTNTPHYFDLSRRDFETLADGEWLSDAPINAYMMLLQQRSAAFTAPDAPFRAYNDRTWFFGTFFYPKLAKDGYEGVRRSITSDRIRQVFRSLPDLDPGTVPTLFALKRLIMPINIGNNHWILAEVYFTRVGHGNDPLIYDVAITIYDELSRYRDAQCPWQSQINTIQVFIQKYAVAVGVFRVRFLHYYKNHGKQSNDFDCGMFCLLNAEAITALRVSETSLANFDFQEKDMTLYRQVAALELVCARWFAHRLY